MSVDRIVPADLEGDELWRRNGAYVSADSYDRALKYIVELEVALRPFAQSAKMMAKDGRTDDEVCALVLGTDLTPSDFWTAMRVMGGNK